MRTFTGSTFSRLKEMDARASTLFHLLCSASLLMSFRVLPFAVNTFLKFFALAMALSQTYSQLAITNGGFAVKFPTGDWSREEPPAALRDAINQHGKLLLYAESSNGKFFVSQFDYPPRGNQVGFVAGFLGGVRKSSAQRGVTVHEEFGTFHGGAWPTYTYSHKV